MYEDLYFDEPDEYQSGSYAIIKTCYYNDKKYAYKEFKQNDYLNGKIKKLNLLSQIDIPNLIIPRFWVMKKDMLRQSYLTNFCESKDIDFLKYENNINKLRIIKSVKNLIILMHQEGIIHADLNPSNILYDNEKSSIIDFDISSYKGYKTNILEANDYCQEFIKKYGIRPELDIFMFNLLTYYLIEDCEYYLVRNNIDKNKYGVFDNIDGRKICNSLFLDGNVLNKDFLIDTIDETSISI